MWDGGPGACGGGFFPATTVAMPRLNCERRAGSQDQAALFEAGSIVSLRAVVWVAIDLASASSWSRDSVAEQRLLLRVAAGASRKLCAECANNASARLLLELSGPWRFWLGRRSQIAESCSISTALPSVLPRLTPESIVGTGSAPRSAAGLPAWSLDSHLQPYLFITGAGRATPPTARQ